MGRWWWVALVVQVGCAVPVRAVGLVSMVDGELHLTASSGSSRRLVAAPGDALMPYLDGLTVEVEGRSAPKSIRVDQWRVSRGRNGLSAWVGTLEAVQDGVVLRERGSGLPLRIDDDTADLLRPWLGRPVMIEGAVDGAFGVKVMFYRPLFPDDGSEVP